MKKSKNLNISSSYSKITLLVAIGLIASPSAFAFREPNKAVYTSFFQQPQTSESAFQLLSEEDQDRILEQQFIENKRKRLVQNIRWVTYTQGPMLLLQSGMIGKAWTLGIKGMSWVDTGASQLYKSWFRKPPAGSHPGTPENGEPVNEGSRSQRAGGDSLWKTVGSTMGSIASGVGVASFTDSISRTLRDWWEDDHQSVVSSIEMKYIRKKRFLPYEAREKIEDALYNAQIDRMSFSTVSQYVNAFVDHPDIDNEVTFDLKKANELLAGYPEALKKRVLFFCFQQAMTLNSKTSFLGHPKNSQAPKDSQKNTSLRGKNFAAYFYGPPGTGKTRLGEIIASLLGGLPFAEISLEGATIDDLIGRSLNSQNPTPGRIAEALKGKYGGNKGKKIVLLVDEFDRVMHSKHPHSADLLPFMLKFLEPSGRRYYNPYFESEVDLSNIVLILTGNSDFTSISNSESGMSDPALKNRLFPIRFNAVEVTNKRAVVWQNFATVLKSFEENRKYSITEKDITVEDRKNINLIIERDSDPGFRTIDQLIHLYLTFVGMRKMYPDVTAMPDEIYQMIKENHQKQLNEDRK